MNKAGFWVFWGGFNMFLAVALGALGAHALKTQLDPHWMAVYQTGVHYQALHALGLLGLGILLQLWGERSLLRWSARLMLIGILLFSGSLYALSLSGITWLGAITPLGGVSFLAAWACLTLAAWQQTRQ